MKTSLLAGAAMLLVASTPAWSADVMATMPAASTYNWSGAYIGLQAGYAWGDSHLQVPNGNYADPDPDGFLGGVYAGYNHQFANNIVLGVEADIAYADLDGSSRGYRPGGAVFPGVEVSGSAKWTGALRARAGYAVDRFLPYVAGGAAFAKYKSTIDEGGTGTDSKTLTGWTIGAGVEYAFANNLIGRFEYRYTDFGNADLIGDVVNLKTHDFRVGIAYKF